MSSERQLHEPWRVRCPEGHCSIRSNHGPVHRSHGNAGQFTKEETESGHDYKGQHYCQRCEQYYDELVDIKTGNTVSRRVIG